MHLRVFVNLSPIVSAPSPSCRITIPIWDCKVYHSVLALPREVSCERVDDVDEGGIFYIVLNVLHQLYQSTIEPRDVLEMFFKLIINLHVYIILLNILCVFFMLIIFLHVWEYSFYLIKLWQGSLHKCFANSLSLKIIALPNSTLWIQHGHFCCLRHALRSYVRRLWGIWGCLVGPSHGPAAATFFAPAYENPIPTDDTGHELLAYSFGTSQSGTSRITPKMYAGEGQIRWDLIESLLNLS